MTAAATHTSTTESPAATTASAPPGRAWRLAIIAACGVLAVILLHGLDAPANAAITELKARLGGDVRNELQFLQQYGAISSLVLVGACILLLDTARRGRVVWLAAATGGNALLALALKMLIGRPRPRFADPDTFLGPLGVYPLTDKQGHAFLAHAWELAKPISADLWSMPSSHTAAGAALSVCLATFYPRLRPMAIVMVPIVAFGRLIFDAHYLTDVIAGATCGYVAATAVLLAMPASLRGATETPASAARAYPAG